MTRPLRGRPPQADRRAQILTAAREVLADRGYAQSSLKQIAEHAGIAQGLLTYYYPTKDALLVDVVSDLDEEVCSRWLNAAADVDDPLERIAAGFDAAVADCLAQPDLLSLMLDLLVVGATNDAVGHRARELLDNLIATIADEVDRISATLPGSPVFDRSEFDLPAAIAAAFDGIFLHSAVREADPLPAFAALRAMLLAFAASATG
jgi:AcrR family transcriptional regulator